MKHDWTTVEAWGRTSAALLASTALSLAFCVILVTGLPPTRDVGLALGVLGGFPVWVGAACYAVLSRTAGRAWMVLLSATTLLGGWAVLSLSFQ
ncbi:MAG: hypothetical protein BRD55_00350 [Bacteroidetes bacterium SW_9_63_38]|nr:MAG: hypothetical protein BRD55_00350 [Bacteroidetes bacterium SW_9_63_38]